MSTTIINGKEVAQNIREGLVAEIAELKAQGHTPGLAVVLVGDDPASQVYVRNKELGCQQVGIESTVIKLDKDISKEKVLKR